MIPRLGAVAGLTLAVLAGPVNQQARFSSRIEEVRVDVLATRDGQPITGLTPADFEIRDNGVAQRISHATSENVPLNIVLALDGSNSVSGERARHLETATHELLAQLQPRDEAALISFGDAVIVRTTLTHDLHSVRMALDDEPPHGNTALMDATHTALLLGDSQPGRALVIVFTDGVEVSSFLDADAVLRTARRSSAVVYAIVPRSVSNQPFLQRVVEATGGEVLAIESSTEVDSAFIRVLNVFRHRYVLSYVPEGVPRGGWHRLQVRVKQRGIDVKARPGYQGD